MNADRLIEHYERIADAQNAIARLRQFVLDLAARGKLVQQEPTEKPASELLNHIGGEKLRIGLKPAPPLDRPSHDSATFCLAQWLLAPKKQPIGR